ncbi:acyltransferase [Sphingorhabdus pulchriflava]|uniref:Acyltransferase n=1 Tax=Sphingorhabdus pulchriflava TaxID=2292257 RepID=A0A371BJ57_9SPHN|nr:lysophospholipid acyltransferase family protein [Sphingorhabdus pulchriflava]RDV07622.1 acyltransferase [Sphingorhabdus pulchriflava]
MTNQIRRPSLVSRLFRRALVWIYRRNGWSAFGEVPEPRKFVLIAAPHTSNWDFLYFIGLTEDLGIMPHFMAKKSLFRWPWKNFMLDMGGVPVDRSSNQNYVQAMIDEFAKRTEFMLTIAPEGTRGAVRKWKTGFYHIALGAKVPLVVGMMDYAKKSGGLGPAIWPTGDFKADMAKIAELYAKVTPKHPGKKMASITGESET